MSETSARREVATRSGGVCELCAAAQAQEWSHRVSRGRLGGWRAANGVHMCPPCHRWCHSEPELARAGGWHVTTGEDPAVVPVWLSRPYPGWWLMVESLDGGHTLIPLADLTVWPVLPPWVPGQVVIPVPRGVSDRVSS